MTQDCRPHCGARAMAHLENSSSLRDFASVYGTMGVFRPSNYTFLYNSTGYIQSCVHLLYLFIVGHFDIDLLAKIVNCTTCALYTCLNHTISYHNCAS